MMPRSKRTAPAGNVGSTAQAPLATISAPSKEKRSKADSQPPSGKGKSPPMDSDPKDFNVFGINMNDTPPNGNIVKEQAKSTQSTPARDPKVATKSEEVMRDAKGSEHWSLDEMKIGLLSYERVYHLNAEEKVAARIQSVFVDAVLNGLNPKKRTAQTLQNKVKEIIGKIRQIRSTVEQSLGPKPPKADPEHEDKMKKRAELVVDLANKVPSKGGLHYRKLPEGVSGHDFLLFIKRNCPRVYSTAKTDGSGSGQKRRLQSREEGEEGEEGGEGGDVKRSKKRSKGVVDLQSALSDLRENLKNDIEMVIHQPPALEPEKFKSQAEFEDRLRVCGMSETAIEALRKKWNYVLLHSAISTQNLTRVEAELEKNGFNFFDWSAICKAFGVTSYRV